MFSIGAPIIVQGADGQFVQVPSSALQGTSLAGAAGQINGLCIF